MAYQKILATSPLSIIVYLSIHLSIHVLFIYQYQWFITTKLQCIFLYICLSISIYHYWLFPFHLPTNGSTYRDVFQPKLSVSQGQLCIKISAHQVQSFRRSWCLIERYLFRSLFNNLSLYLSYLLKLKSHYLLCHVKKSVDKKISVQVSI